MDIVSIAIKGGTNYAIIALVNGELARSNLVIFYMTGNGQILEVPGWKDIEGGADFEFVDSFGRDFLYLNNSRRGTPNNILGKIRVNLICCGIDCLSCTGQKPSVVC